MSVAPLLLFSKWHLAQSPGGAAPQRAYNVPGSAKQEKPMASTLIRSRLRAQASLTAAYGGVERVCAHTIASPLDFIADWVSHNAPAVS